MAENIVKLKQQAEESSRRRWWFHWQNLNDRKNGKSGSPWRHGRCWWHFGDRVIRFEWCLWSIRCHLGFEFTEEDLMFYVGFPPFSFYLSFDQKFPWISRITPRRILSPNYPDTIVTDERQCSLAIHSGRLWVKLWGTDDWVRADPWWKRGFSIRLNIFEWTHNRHEVRGRLPGTWTYFWEPYVAEYEHHAKVPDKREKFQYHYRYALKDGTVQHRIARVYVERYIARPWLLRWAGLIEKTRTSINVEFDREVGERTGSWKGGCIGCGWDLKPDETPEQCLRRMEKERKFD